MNNDQRGFTRKAVELQKMTTLNITFGAMGLETRIDLAKVATTQCLISLNHKI